MTTFSSGWRRFSLALLCCATIVACSDSSDRPPVPPPIDPEPPEPELTYSAEVVWTEYGIPHITADDWGSLGYGSGYSYAQLNFCVAMKEYIRAEGESARYFGEAGDLNQDLIMKLFNDDERIQGMIENDLPDYIIELMEGYAAGVNRYLAETGVDQLAEGEEGCRGEEWVREIDVMDAVRLIHRLALRGSARPLADYTVAAQPSETTAQNLSPTEAAQMLAQLDPQVVTSAIDLPQAWEVGSNAYAVGEQASQTNSGILFGNPHFPWQGAERFAMSHLTMGDDYDMMGATLHGLMVPGIGFNKNVAWSHTVSIANRFTLYELELNPDNPMEYIYDGEIREFEARTVSAGQMLADGSVDEVEHTFYFSHYGPVLDLGTVTPLLGGWPNGVGTLLTYRDANLGNLRAVDQIIKMGQAGNLSEFKEALAPVGLFLFNTIAADRNGDAFYGDISAVPHVSVNQYDNCIRGPLQIQLTGFGLPTMDGTDPECEWGSDEGTAEGIFGYDSLPKLETRDYAANANDSYWLPNPRNLLQGYSPILGPEGVEQSKRTRHTLNMAEKRLIGADGLGDPGFNIDNIREMSYQSTNYVAELMLVSTVEVCNETQDWSEFTDDPANAQQACEILGAWDGSHRLDSVGAHVFFEYWEEVKALEDAEGDAYLWSVPFDVTMPVFTPLVLKISNEVNAGVRQSLANAADKLKAAGIPLDRPWGEVQFDEKNGERIGIHGGSSGMMFSVITSDLVDGEGYSNIRHGNSYMQAVTWDETDCPDAYAILTFSQSTDPASDHYADATKLYSEGGWIDMPFCEAARDEQEIGRMVLEE